MAWNNLPFYFEFDLKNVTYSDVGFLKGELFFMRIMSWLLFVCLSIGIFELKGGVVIQLGF